MVVYSYDGRTGRFTHAEHADPDPLEPGKWLVPANAVEVQPPAPVGTQWPYWSKNYGAWMLKDEGTEAKEREMRAIRNAALCASDWTMLADVPIEGELRGLWAYYRQQLRDLPNNPAWPFVEMPTKPNAKNGNV